jgi:F420-non-reducing hydrogenase iron-sulfur subunit
MNSTLQPFSFSAFQNFSSTMKHPTQTSQPPETAPPANEWQPRIAAFFCNWCTYTAADLAGVSRLKYAPNVRIIRLMCSGRVDPQFILEAFAKGADGVLIGGCHPGDCHYAEGNYKALRRFQMLTRLAAQMGINPQRLRLEWISASEGDKVRSVINDMVDQVRALGPLNLQRTVPVPGRNDELVPWSAPVPGRSNELTAAGPTLAPRADLEPIDPQPIEACAASEPATDHPQI